MDIATRFVAALEREDDDSGAPDDDPDLLPTGRPTTSPSTWSSGACRSTNCARTRTPTTERPAVPPGESGPADRMEQREPPAAAADPPWLAEPRLASCAAATEKALADGFGGLRVSADVTELVRTLEQQDAFARCEFLITRYVGGHGRSTLCGYDHELGIDTVTDFSSLHTAEPFGKVAFHIFGCAMARSAWLDSSTRSRSQRSGGC